MQILGKQFRLASTTNMGGKKMNEVINVKVKDESNYKIIEEAVDKTVYELKNGIKVTICDDHAFFHDLVSPIDVKLKTFDDVVILLHALSFIDGEALKKRFNEVISAF